MTKKPREPDDNGPPAPEPEHAGVGQPAGVRDSCRPADRIDRASVSPDETPADPPDRMSALRGGNPAVDRRPPQRPMEYADLDEFHYRVVEAVLLRDTSDTREVAARQYAAAAQSDIDELVKEQRDIGTKEQVDAIRRTGACPDARYWLIGSWLLVAVDTALWFVVGARLLTV